MRKWQLTARAFELLSNDISGTAEVKVNIIGLSRENKDVDAYAIDDAIVKFNISEVQENTLKFDINNKEFTQTNYDGGSEFLVYLLIANIFYSDNRPTEQIVYGVLQMDKPLTIPDNSQSFDKKVEATMVFSKVLNVVNIMSNNPSNNITSDNLNTEVEKIIQPEITDIKKKLEELTGNKDTGGDPTNNIIGFLTNR